jgi:hypothetical protein
MDLAIYMASIGCVSGKLKEWPVLVAALKNAGYKVTGEEDAEFARQLCLDIETGK